MMPGNLIVIETIKVLIPADTLFLADERGKPILSQDGFFAIPLNRYERR